VNPRSIFAALALLVACVNVPQNPPPSPVIVAEFDPGAAIPVVPTPNDLAKDATTGRIVVPVTPGESAAQTEFDQEYLGSLTGFPFESTGEALFSGPLDPTTVNAQTVLAFDLGTSAAPSQTPVTIVPTWDPTHLAIVIPAPANGWTRAHEYALVLVGDAMGLRGAQGENVIGSPTWALVSSTTSLVTCQDLTSPDCRPAVDVIPSSLTDPAARLADQTSKAIALEELRRAYAPLLDALAAQGLTRDEIPLAWTFTVLDAGEATFDPANDVIPFPNDVLRSNGKVSLPNPKTLQPLTQSDCTAPTDPLIQITCGLNTLDGFSTIAPPISENSDTLAAAEQATLAGSSLTTSSVGIVPVASQAPSGEQTKPEFSPCLNCLSSTDSNGNPQVTPQQLQWALSAPLDEKTTYLAYVTSDVVDDQGKNLVANPTFALLRSSNPLYDGTHSTVSELTDAEAAQLEPLRAALAPALDGLAQAGVPRAKLALAFAFTTQSESTLLDGLYAYPSSLTSLPDSPLYLVDATAQYEAEATAGSIPFSAIGKVYIGAFLTPVAVTGTGGTFDVTNPSIQEVEFVLYLPATAAPASGYPLTVFAHAFTRWRGDSIAIANSLASAGQAVIAADELDHGDRSSCTGSKAATNQSTDDASCADPTTEMCNENPLVGRCVARSSATRAACAPSAGDPTGDLACMAIAQGRCETDGMCEGGDFLRDATGRPVISGWNIFNLSNFFATRDNLRQQVIDLSQLERVIVGQGATSLSTLAGASFDPQKLGFVGQSLGSFSGSLELAVSPRITNAALNVGGGVLTNVLLTSPSFAADKAALLASLAQLGLQPGTPAFDSFIGIAQWIVDPADPANVGYRLTHGVSVTQGNQTYTAPNAARRAFLQFIEGDQTVPNTSEIALVAAANRSFSPTPPSFGCVSPLFCYEFTEAGDGFDATTATPATRHTFLISPPSGSAGPGLTVKAQTQVATFLATGQLP